MGKKTMLETEEPPQIAECGSRGGTVSMMMTAERRVAIVPKPYTGSQTLRLSQRQVSLLWRFPHVQ